MDLAAHLARFQLLVVTGKGGVGKTAVSAALGGLLAAAGRRVLVLEVDPRENVHQMLGVAPSGGAIVAAPAAAAARPQLYVQNLKPGQVLDEIVRERLKIEMVARRVLASPIYEQFAAGAPGLKELAILGHALRLLRREGPPDAPAVDLVVLDAPATGHGVRLLAAPSLVAGVIHGGPFGALAGELAAFVTDPARCGIVVVTQAEEMPVEEALELRAALREQLGRDPELLVVNGLYPPLPAGAGGSAQDSAPLHDLWVQRRRLNERELVRLAAAWEGPRVQLPLLALERGPRLTAALQSLLAQGLAAPASSAPSGAGGADAAPAPSGAVPPPGRAAESAAG